MANKLTVPEAAIYSGLSKPTIYNAIKDDKLKATRDARGMLVVSRAALELWRDDKAYHKKGKPPLGEISYEVAGRMLGITREAVSYHVRKGNLPRAMTAEAVVEFALRRGYIMRYETRRPDGYDKFAIVDLQLGAYIFLLVDGQDVIGPRYLSNSLTELCDAMKTVAPPTDWRVVK